MWALGCEKMLCRSYNLDKPRDCLEVSGLELGIKEMNVSSVKIPMVF